MSVNVRELFSEAKAKKEAANDIRLSAGAIPKMSGRDNRKCLWPQHKQDKIDNICVEYKDKGGYAQWQKDRYPIKVEFPSWVKKTRTFTSDLNFKEVFSSNCEFRRADFNYQR